MLKKYKFWSIYCPSSQHWMYKDKGGWLLIPPNEKYLPKNYPPSAVKKHEEEILPPPSYWLDPSYETIVYNNWFNSS